MAEPASDPWGSRTTLIQVSLLGPFTISTGDRTVLSWRRPPARRLCQLVLLSPGRRISREEGCLTPFPNLDPDAAGRALSQALSYARAALHPLGEEASRLMQADKSHIWANPSVPVHIDLEIQQERLRLALGADPGMERDDMIVAALANERVLLESETLAEWAHRPREHLEWERQEARLVLARARARGLGRSSQEAVVRAWAACLSHDPTCEEAASALMRAYSAQSRWALVEATYRRCRAALEELGLRPSPALDEVHTSSRPTGTSRPGTERSRAPVQPRGDREQRIVTCLFVELSGPLATGQWLGPEELSERVGVRWPRWSATSSPLVAP